MRSYDVTGADFENSLYAFGQSEKSYRVQCIIISIVINDLINELSVFEEFSENFCRDNRITSLVSS